LNVTDHASQALTVHRACVSEAMTSKLPASGTATPTITVTFKPPGIGTTVKKNVFVLFPGLSDSSLMQSVRYAFGLAESTPVLLCNAAGQIVPLCSNTPPDSYTLRTLAGPSTTVAVALPQVSMSTSASPVNTTSIKVSKQANESKSVVESSADHTPFAQFTEFPEGDCVTSAMAPSSRANDDGEQEEFLHLGWATIVSAQKHDRRTGRRSWTKKCLGNLECPVKGCDFAVRPAVNSKKRAAQQGLKCRFHNRQLVSLACNAKCILTKSAPVDGQITYTRKHSGHHAHRHPPPARASPEAKRAFQAQVLASPSTSPHALQVGNRLSKPVTKLHAVYNNLGTVQAQRRQILKSRAVDDSFAGLKAWQDENKEQAAFIHPQSSSVSAKNGHIFLQLPGMKHQLSTLEGALETDAIESMIESPDNSCLVFSTAFQPELLRNVPVALCILFGRSSAHYYEYFAKLLQDIPFVLDSKGKLSWIGMTADFSDAQRLGFMQALEERLISANICATDAEAKKLAPNLLKVKLISRRWSLNNCVGL